MPRPTIQGPADPAKAEDDASASALLDRWLGDRWQVCALFLDVDGTLLDIAAHPDAVSLPAELRLALESLHRRLDGALALVSGRTVADLDRIFAPLRLPACGVHGGQWRSCAEGPLHGEAVPSVAASILERLEAFAGAHAGVLVENKGSSIALHYRAAPAAARALASTLRELLGDPEAAGLRLLPGKMVFEVMAHACDKAQAIRLMMEIPPFAGRLPVFIGDDVTDEPALAMMADMGGMALSVGRPLPGVDRGLDRGPRARTDRGPGRAALA